MIIGPKSQVGKPPLASRDYNEQMFARIMNTKVQVAQISKQQCYLVDIHGTYYPLLNMLNEDKLKVFH